MPTRYPSSSASAWTLGGVALIADLHDANVKQDGKHEDVSGVGDAWQYALVLKYDCEIDATMYITSDTVELSIGQTITVVYITGPVSYGGNFVITSTHHTVPKDGVQMLKLTLKTQGQPTE